MGIDLQDMAASDVSLPSGRDLVRAWTCSILARNTQVFHTEGDRPRMFLRLSTVTTPDGLPAVEGLSALILSETFGRCGLLDHDQAYRAAMLNRTYDRYGFWRRDEPTGWRSKPSAPRWAYHMTFGSAADRLPGYILPGARDTDVEKHAEAVSHGW